MAQVEDPANLGRWDDPGRRLITLILIRCGLRVGDACKLPSDCIVTDGDGQPYLRYFNHKMKREALVPVDDELVAEIGRQRQRNTARWPGGTPVLFPRPTKNINGTVPVTGDAYRGGLRRWLASCDIRGQDGSPIRLTPHQFRHSLGTTLKVSRIASGASFGSLREHALPAAQRAALWRAGSGGGRSGMRDLRCHQLAG